MATTEKTPAMDKMKTTTDGKQSVPAETPPEAPRRWDPEEMLEALQDDMALPFEPRADKIEATLNHGVLEVRIPKPEGAESKAKEIPIK